MKSKIIIVVIALLSFEGFSQDLNTFFSKADAFFKANVANGKSSIFKHSCKPRRP